MPRAGQKECRRAAPQGLGWIPFCGGSGATVDRHLADQVIPFAALAKGTSTFCIPSVTEHVEARLWLIEKILGARPRIHDHIVTIDGIGLVSEK